MRFLKNLFKSSAKKEEKEPDNTRLLELIERYIADNEYESYKKVVLELEEGNAYLLLPSDNDWTGKFPIWTPSPPGLKMKLGIWLIDGLKATAAFTSEQALFEWAKEPAKYVSIRSQSALEIFEKGDFFCHNRMPIYHPILNNFLVQQGYFWNEWLYYVSFIYLSTIYIRIARIASFAAT